MLLSHIEARKRENQCRAEIRGKGIERWKPEAISESFIPYIFQECSLPDINSKPEYPHRTVNKRAFTHLHLSLVYVVVATSFWPIYGAPKGIDSYMGDESQSCILYEEL